MENQKNPVCELEMKHESAYSKLGTEGTEKAYEYAKGYVKFIDAAKTEREAVAEAVRLAEANGYKSYEFGDAVKAGDKLYYNNRGKSIFLFKIGSEDIECGIRITAAHVDAPRIDLKQHPLYEDSGMAFLKTHYYGGIKKYQWTATPLALHGVIYKANGECVTLNVGEDEGDPLFYINDLLPHLAQAQAEKPLGKAIEGETLNILVGSRPLDDSDGDKQIKYNVLKLINDKYGITEEDFISAELSLVPAFKARDIGFDRALIGAYGHDDRVCAYPALTSLFECEDSVHTIMCILADKEEVGSTGNTGMQCRIISDLIEEISRALGGNPNRVRAKSMCLSADVSAAYDPNFAEVYERRNSAMLSGGAVLSKYTGSRGKSGTNDTSAEYLSYIRGIFARDNVAWQCAELGRVDVGGGGTVAMFIAKHNIETVDLGVPVISMHAPYEVISKVDLYMTHRAFVSFCRG